MMIRRFRFDPFVDHARVRNHFLIVLCDERWWDVSYPTILLGVETIRIPRAEECGPPGEANACNDKYHLNMSRNLVTRRRQNNSRIVY